MILWLFMDCRLLWFCLIIGSLVYLGIAAQTFMTDFAKKTLTTKIKVAKADQLTVSTASEIVHNSKTTIRIITITIRLSLTNLWHHLIPDTGQILIRGLLYLVMESFLDSCSDGINFKSFPNLNLEFKWKNRRLIYIRGPDCCLVTIHYITHLIQGSQLFRFNSYCKDFSLSRDERMDFM